MISDRYNNCFWETTGQLNCKPAIPNVNYRASDFSKSEGMAPIPDDFKGVNKLGNVKAFNCRVCRRHSPIVRVTTNQHTFDERDMLLDRIQTNKLSILNRERLPVQSGGSYQYEFERQGEAPCYKPVCPSGQKTGTRPGEPAGPPGFSRGACLCNNQTATEQRILSRFPHYNVFNAHGNPIPLPSSHHCDGNAKLVHPRHYVNPEEFTKPVASQCPVQTQRVDTGRDSCTPTEKAAYFPDPAHLEQNLVRVLGRPSVNNRQATSWNKRSLKSTVYGVFEEIALLKDETRVAKDPFPHKTLVEVKMYIRLPRQCCYSNLPVKYDGKLLTVTGPSLRFVCAVIAFLAFSAAGPFTFSCKLLREKYLAPEILCSERHHNSHLKTIYRHLNTTLERVRDGVIGQ